MTRDPAVDAARCPLCGGDNACGAEAGAGNCWCQSVDFTKELLARVPEAARDKACICVKCAGGFKESSTLSS